MTDILAGVRILEVAEHTFVPAASAVLAEYGADVIKIEHVERGDAMRGLASTGVANLAGDVHALLEHSNRGKRSLGLDLASEEGIEVLGKIAATSDVFLTNKMPSVIEKLGIGVDAIRASNPNIIYVRGTGQGVRGPDADKGSYDALGFWARAGVALGSMRPEYEHVPPPPAPAYGDSIGAMTIAGGIMGALFHKERTGEGTVVDVSLFGTGLWSMGAGIALSDSLGIPWTVPPADQMARNPLVNIYETADDRHISLCCLQAGKYWQPFCEIVGRDELISDERFNSHLALLEHGAEAVVLIQEEFAKHDLATWRERLEPFTGQWAVVQDMGEAAVDPQTVANGYFQECTNADGHAFKMIAPPVQYDETPAAPKRAPEFNEHGDEILGEIGLDMDAIIDLKVKGVVA